MTTYNTGNPVGSVDVRDLYDNAENLDKFTNGPLDAYPDRFGVPRQSLAGMEAEFDADQVDRAAQWAAFLLASGYQVLGPYGVGLVFTAPNQLFSYLGEFYAPGPSITLPYTTTGAGAGEIANFRSVGDAVLRQDLANDTDPIKGAYLVGYKGRTLYDRAGEKVSVKDFGALGNNVADDTVAIQACFDYCTEFGGTAYFPQGTYVISSTVTLFEDIGTEEPLGGDTKACIRGEGSGLSVLRWTGGNTPALRIHGEVTSLQSVKGIGLLGNGAGTGLSLRDLAWFHCEDVMVTGFEYGVYGDNVLSSKFDTLVSRGNKFGFRLQRLDGVYASHPNAITLINCDIGLNTEWGAYIFSPGVVNIFGGAIQGNGIGGVLPARWGIRVVDAGTEGAAGLNMFGVYMEANVGLADVFIEQLNYSAPHSIIGCGFTRIAGNFTDHCIRVDNSTLVMTRLTLNGNGFLSGAGYVPAPGRAYLIVANPSTGFMLSESGSFYSSPVETHDLTGRHVTVHTSVAAAAEYDGTTSTAIRYINIASVTPAGAGLYDVVFSTPMASNTYVAAPAISGDVGFAYTTNKLASGFRVNTRDFTGTPADQKWAVTVFD